MIAEKVKGAEMSEFFRAQPDTLNDRVRRSQRPRSHEQHGEMTWPCRRTKKQNKKNACVYMVGGTVGSLGPVSLTKHTGRRLSSNLPI